MVLPVRVSNASLASRTLKTGKLCLICPSALAVQGKNLEFHLDIRYILRYL
jgi:hypothetical protein